MIPFLVYFLSFLISSSWIILTGLGFSLSSVLCLAPLACFLICKLKLMIAFLLQGCNKNYIIHVEYSAQGYIHAWYTVSVNVVVMLEVIFFLSHWHPAIHPHLIFPLVYITNPSIDLCHVRSVLPLHSPFIYLQVNGFQNFFQKVLRFLFFYLLCLLNFSVYVFQKVLLP